MGLRRGAPGCAPTTPAATAALAWVWALAWAPGVSRSVGVGVGVDAAMARFASASDASAVFGCTPESHALESGVDGFHGESVPFVFVASDLRCSDIPETAEFEAEHGVGVSFRKDIYTYVDDEMLASELHGGLAGLEGRVVFVEQPECAPGSRSHEGWDYVASFYALWLTMRGAVANGATGVVMSLPLDGQMSATFSLCDMLDPSFCLPSCTVTKEVGAALKARLAGTFSRAGDVAEFDTRGLLMNLADPPVPDPLYTAVRTTASGTFGYPFPAVPALFTPASHAEVTAAVTVARFKDNCTFTRYGTAEDPATSDGEGAYTRDLDCRACWSLPGGPLKNADEVRGKVLLFAHPTDRAMSASTAQLLVETEEADAYSLCHPWFYMMASIAEDAGAIGVLLDTGDPLLGDTPGPSHVGVNLTIPILGIIPSNAQKIRSSVEAWEASSSSGANGSSSASPRLNVTIPAFEEGAGLLPFYADTLAGSGFAPIHLVWHPPTAAVRASCESTGVVSPSKTCPIGACCCYAGQSEFGPRTAFAGQPNATATIARAAAACYDTDRCLECPLHVGAWNVSAGLTPFSNFGALNGSVVVMEEAEFACFFTYHQFVEAAEAAGATMAVVVGLTTAIYRMPDMHDNTSDAEEVSDYEPAIPSYNVDKSCYRGLGSAFTGTFEHDIPEREADGESLDALVDPGETYESYAEVFTSVQVIGPPEIAGAYLAGQSEFNPVTHPSVTAALAVGLLHASCGAVSKCGECEQLTSFVAEGVTPSLDWSGRVVLFHMEDIVCLTLSSVVYAAQDAGAVGLLFTNEDDAVYTYVPSDIGITVTVPSFNLQRIDGLFLGSRVAARVAACEVEPQDCVRVRLPAIIRGRADPNVQPYVEDEILEEEKEDFREELEELEAAAADAAAAADRKAPAEQMMSGWVIAGVIVVGILGLSGVVYTVYEKRRYSRRMSAYNQRDAGQQAGLMEDAEVGGELEGDGDGHGSDGYSDDPEDARGWPRGHSVGAGPGPNPLRGVRRGGNVLLWEGNVYSDEGRTVTMTNTFVEDPGDPSRRALSPAASFTVADLSEDSYVRPYPQHRAQEVAHGARRDEEGSSDEVLEREMEMTQWAGTSPGTMATGNHVTDEDLADAGLL